MTVTDDWKGEHLIPVPRKQREPERPIEGRVFCTHPGCRVLLCKANKNGMCRSHWAKLAEKTRHSRGASHR